MPRKFLGENYSPNQSTRGKFRIRTVMVCFRVDSLFFFIESDPLFVGGETTGYQEPSAVGYREEETRRGKYEHAHVASES